MVDIESVLDHSVPDGEAFLDGIQGNIVKGHGRDHTAHILLRMSGPAGDVASWISDFKRDHVTSAGEGLRQTQRWIAGGRTGTGEPFAMLLLSAGGYRYLGFTDTQLPRPRQDRFTSPFHEQYFLRGMKEQATLPRRYKDPPSAQWEEPYQGSIDAMVLLADDDRARLDRRIDALAATVHELFAVCAVERGDVLRADFPRGRLIVEHFGFQDGVSQPIMIKADLDDELKARGGRHWNPEAPLGLALVEHLGGHGSFMVFRKLEVITGLLVVDVALPIPSSLVMVAAAVTLPPATAFAACFAGLMLSCALGYGLGLWLGEPLLDRMAGKQERDAVSSWFARHGFLGIALCRPVPVLGELSVVMAGSLRAPILPFLLNCAAANAGIAGVYVVLGAQVSDTPSFIAAFAASCILPAIGWLVARSIGRAWVQIDG
jgi:membrane protein DedA with SNARE-associated domain